jgi:hypothetical protein
MLFNGEYVPRQAANGLMWLTIACGGASPDEAWIADLCLAAFTRATDERGAAALADLERWLSAQWVQNRNKNKLEAVPEAYAGNGSHILAAEMAKRIRAFLEAERQT